MLPRQNGRMPSSRMIRAPQSITPVYGRSRRPDLSISSWFWTMSLTRSIGAAAVLEITAAAPERRKFSANDKLFLDLPIVSSLVNYQKITLT